MLCKKFKIFSKLHGTVRGNTKVHLPWISLAYRQLKDLAYKAACMSVHGKHRRMGASKLVRIS